MNTLQKIRHIMRTNPNDQSPSPCKRWFKWQGGSEGGKLSYYDKETQVNIVVSLPFDFILLDKLSVIKGWHDASESGIWSNEVRKTTEEPFTVKAFKMKDKIAEGFYSEIKYRVKAAGGRFNINLYIAFKNEEGDLGIGSLMLHGASMSAWIEFEKKYRKEVFAYGIKIKEFEEGKKGGITFRKPVFDLWELDKETDDKAGELQKELSVYLTKYLSRGQPEGEHVDRSKEYDQTPQDEELEEIPF